MLENDIVYVYNDMRTWTLQKETERKKQGIHDMNIMMYVYQFYMYMYLHNSDNTLRNLVT